MFKHLSFVFAVAVVGGMAGSNYSSADIISTYNFDSLSVGALAGQDNWQNMIANGTAVTVTADFSSYAGISSPNIAHVNSAGGGPDQRLSRVNNGSYSFPTLSTTTFTIQYVMKVGAQERIWVGLGHDASNNGVMEFAERSFAFGHNFGANNEGKWYYEMAPGVGSVGGKSDSVSGPSPNTSATGIWLVRMDVDILANGGDGAGVMSVQKLADASGTAVSDVLTPVLFSGSTSINLGITKNAAASDPSQWDAWWIAIVPATFSNTRSGVDSLTVIVPEEIPEPSTLVLAGLALVGGFLFRRRR